MNTLDLTNLSSLLSTSTAPVAPPQPIDARASDFNQHLLRLTQPAPRPPVADQPSENYSDDRSSRDRDSQNASQPTTKPYTTASHTQQKRTDRSTDSRPAERAGQSPKSRAKSSASRKSTRDDRADRSSGSSADSTSGAADDSQPQAKDSKSDTGANSKPAAKDDSARKDATATNDELVLASDAAATQAAAATAVTPDASAATSENMSATGDVQQAQANGTRLKLVQKPAGQPPLYAKAVQQQTAAAALNAGDQAAKVQPVDAQNNQKVVGDSQTPDNAQTSSGDASQTSTSGTQLSQTTAVVQLNPAVGEEAKTKGDDDKRDDKTKLGVANGSLAQSQEEKLAAADPSATANAAANQSAAIDVPTVPTATTSSDSSKSAADGATSKSDRATAAVDRLSDKATPDAKATSSNTPAKLAGGSGSAKQTDGQSSNLTEAERVRFVQRVARAVQSADAQSGPLRIRLSPPELGSLKLEVVVKDGVMSAKIEAETPQARTALLDNLPQLRERLAEQNIKVERFDVDLMNQQSPGGTPDQRYAEANNAMARNRIRGGNSSSTSSTTTPAVTSAPKSGQLNIVI